MKFTEEDRRIYQYEIPGEDKTRFDDPLRLRRAFIVASGGKIDALWADRCSPIPGLNENTDPTKITGEQSVLLVKQSIAEAAIVEAVRKVFEVAAVDKTTGAGITDAVCLRLYEEFSGWMEQKKTSGGNGPE